MMSDQLFFSGSNEHEEEEEEDDDTDEEEKRSLRDKSYARHLPELQNLVKLTFGDSKPNLVTDKTEVRCAVCPTPQWFKGWNALSKHAETFKKKRIQQHRGYFEAIKEAIRVHGTASLRGEDLPANPRTASLDPVASSNHLIVWPPIVYVYGHGFEKSKDLQKAVLDFLEREAPNLRLPQFIDAPRSRALLVFKGEALGYLEAKEVAKSFSERGDQSLGLRGYLATPRDMKLIDPERSLVKWTEENQYLRVQQAQKRDKEEHDNEKAWLKEIELQVESLAENELKFKERREHYEQLIEFKQKEIEKQKKKAEELEKAHHDRMQRLEVHLQNEIRIFEATSASRLKRCRQELQENEERLEDERLKRMKEIESLQQQFQSVTRDIKQKETQKALEKELEVMQRKKNFMAELAKAEAHFNEIARNKESALQERQHQEEMKLMEEAKKEREQLLQEWLTKQQREKKEKEQPMQEASECCMCMDILNLENRAVFHPCGHARICLECAMDVYETASKQCPICRQTIRKKPELLPKFYL